MEFINYTKGTVWLICTGDGTMELYGSKPKGESIELKFMDKAVYETNWVKYTA